MNPTKDTFRMADESLSQLPEANRPIFHQPAMSQVRAIWYGAGIVFGLTLIFMGMLS